MATVDIRPNGDYSISGLTTSDGETTNFYSYIDEVTASDIDYLIAGRPEGKFAFKFPSSGLSSNASISKITLHIRASGSDKTPVTILAYFYINSTHYTSSGIISVGTSSYVNYSMDVAQNPYTKEDWTTSDVTSLIAGFAKDVTRPTGDDVHISQLYFTITYADGWSGKINGVTPAKINGIAITNIAKVSGV